MNRDKIILASRSPRRLELLSTIVPRPRIVVCASNIKETIGPGESAEDYCQRIAREKAMGAWKEYPGTRESVAAVIGADTVVVLGREIIGQPRDRDDAVHILRKLSGRQHAVITGVALIFPPETRLDTFAVKSKVWTRRNDDQVIADYVATGEPLDKAGAYAIQGQGSRLVAGYDGSYSNIVGLPVDELKRVLARVLQ